MMNGRVAGCDCCSMLKTSCRVRCCWLLALPVVGVFAVAAKVAFEQLFAPEQFATGKPIVCVDDANEHAIESLADSRHCW